MRTLQILSLRTRASALGFAFMLLAPQAGPRAESALNVPVNPAVAADSAARNTYVFDRLPSADGTMIGYRKIGTGPGLILVEGAMSTAQNYDQLARALARDFTVYIPDRRGRGASPLEFTSAHTVKRDLEDLESLLTKTDAHFLFGLSSGAVIALEATRNFPAVHKVVLYEPPFYLHGMPSDLSARFSKEVQEGHLPSAFVTAVRIVKVGAPPYVPRPFLEFGIWNQLRKEDKEGAGPYAPLRELIPSMRYDFKIVSEIGGDVEPFRSVQQEVLLLGGSKSPEYLISALDALQKVLPHAERTEFNGLDHSGTWNADKGGHPGVVAESMRRFFLP